MSFDVADFPPSVGFALRKSSPEQWLVLLVALQVLRFCVLVSVCLTKVYGALQDFFPEYRLILLASCRRLRLLVRFVVLVLLRDLSAEALLLEEHRPTKVRPFHFVSIALALSAC